MAALELRTWVHSRSRISKNRFFLVYRNNRSTVKIRERQYEYTRVMTRIAMHDLSGGAVFEFNNYIAAAVHCTLYSVYE